MKILLVHNQSILLDGVANLLTRSAHDLVEKANTVEDALSYFAETEFDLLITDFNLIDDAGLALISKVKRIYPNIKVIVLSMQEESFLIKEVLKDSTGNYTIKKGSRPDLAEALAMTNKNEVPLNEELTRILNKAIQGTPKPKLLTAREQDVLQLIAEGYPETAVAEKLAISERAVTGHLNSIFRKTKTNTVIGLLKYAYAKNLL